MAFEKYIQQSVLSKKAHVNSKDWHAWINTMPGGPHTAHVVGSIQVGNPGIYALLQKKIPQGINPAYLLLDLHLIQRPGIWPQHVVWVPANYTEVLSGHDYQFVEIFSQNESIVKLEFEIVS